MLRPIEASYMCRERSATRTCSVVVVDKIMLGAWPKMPTSPFGRVDSNTESKKSITTWTRPKIVTRYKAASNDADHSHSHILVKPWSALKLSAI